MLDVLFGREDNMNREELSSPPEKEPSFDTKMPMLPSGTVDNRCGIRNSEGIAYRILGDEDNEAAFAEFPW